MAFYRENFSDYEDFNHDFSSRKGKKNFKKRKGEDFERGFGNNKKKNKPKRGNRDYDDY
jgi:hypothetical protein